MMNWDWGTFLRRPLLLPDASKAKAAVEGKRVLITGAGGSIGTAVAEAVLRGEPRNVVICDWSEYALYEVFRRLAGASKPQTKVVPILGDILNPLLLRNTLAQHAPDLVFHAAAFKQVPLLETNPFAAIRNNAVGSLRLVHALLEQDNCQLVLVSTDKAVEPVSVLGASKCIAELAVLAHARPNSLMSVLRLSNVLESSGSVVPLFAEQLEQGVALTVTHPQARRCLMTRSEASHALLLAAESGISGKVLIPDCGEAVAIVDLAHYMVGRARKLSGNFDDVPVNVKMIGLRAGEKLVERLTSWNETLEQALPSGLLVYRSPCPEAPEVDRLILHLEQAIDQYNEEEMFLAIHALVPEYRQMSHSPKDARDGFAELVQEGT